MLFQHLEEVQLFWINKAGKSGLQLTMKTDCLMMRYLQLGYDKSGGLWLSHQFGLTRADLNLPVGNFSIYHGLKGNLTTSLKHNNELYVATSEGVFYLAKVKSYSQTDVLVKNENIKRSDPIPTTSVTPSLISPGQKSNCTGGAK